MAQLDETISSGQTGHISDHQQLAKKANYVFDVTDYGAVGDGVTDDTAAIQAAIDAAEANGGGDVVFPPGTYLVSKTAGTSYCTRIDSPKVTVRGLAGHDITHPDDDADVFYVEGTYDIHFENLVVKGDTSRALDAASTAGGGISVSRSFKVWVYGCVISRFGGNALAFSGQNTAKEGSTTTAYDYYCINNRLALSDKGLLVFNGANRAMISGNMISKNNYGLFADDGSTGTVDYNAPFALNVVGNVFYQNGYVNSSYGCSLIAVNDSTVTGNLFFEQGADAASWVNARDILLSAGGSQSNNVATRNMISGNQFVRPAGHAIVLAGATKTLISNNQVFDAGYGASSGLRAILISTNTLANGTVQESGDTVVDGLRVREDDGTADMNVSVRIDHANTANCIIRNVTDNGLSTGGVSDSGTGTIIESITVDGVVTVPDSSMVYSGTGTPEGSVTAVIGGLYRRSDGGAGTTLYVKESGSGNTGWVAK